MTYPPYTGPDPQSIGPYTAVFGLFTTHAVYEGGKPRDLLKYAVVLWHDWGALHSLLGTTKIAWYVANPARETGCVKYDTGTCAHFPKTTRLEPHVTGFAPYDRFMEKGGEVYGPMPTDFHEQLIDAIAHNGEMEDDEKAFLSARLPVAPDMP